MDRLSEVFGLLQDPYMQDWEIVCADPGRVGDFLDFYLHETIDDDEKFTLMSLILGSFEQYHGQNGPDALVWGRIKEILEADIGIHSYRIEYYQCLDAESEKGWFPITRLMRQIQIPTPAMRDTETDSAS